MNILGVGGEEFVIIIVIMLVVAGPKRMVQWMYILGTYVAKFRRMWEETVDVLQDEFDSAGVGIQLPREVPTRANLKREAAKAMSGITGPMQEALKDVNTEVNQIKTVTKDTAQAANSTVKAANASINTAAKPTNGRSNQAVMSRVNKPQSKPKAQTNFGTWAGDSGSDGDSGFGTWSSNGRKPQSKE